MKKSTGFKVGVSFMFAVIAFVGYLIAKSMDKGETFDLIIIFVSIWLVVGFILYTGVHLEDEKD